MKPRVSRSTSGCFDFVHLRCAPVQSALWTAGGVPSDPGRLPLSESCSTVSAYLRSFAQDTVKQIQWRAFWKKAVRHEPKPDLPQVVTAVSRFLLPVVVCAKRQETQNDCRQATD